MVSYEMFRLCCTCSSFIIITRLALALSFVDQDNLISIPNSCRDLPDGTHILKLLDDETAPLVSVECSNGFTLIDISQDSGLLQYFSSSIMWHKDYAGPTSDDHVNWHDWWLPSSREILDSNSNSETSFEFLYSEYCNDCDDIVTGHYADTPSDEGGYLPYMTGNMFGCFWTVRGVHNYDFDWDTHECFYHISGTSTLVNDTFTPCDPVSSRDYTYQQIHSFPSFLTGACPTFPLSSTYSVAVYHDVKHNVFPCFFFVLFFVAFFPGLIFCLRCLSTQRIIVWF